MFKINTYFSNSEGKIHILILLIIVLFAVFLSGGFFKYHTPENLPGGSQTNQYTCCDSGDGEECKLNDDQKLTFRGDEYALIKSDVALVEGSGHIATRYDTTPDNKFIFLNTTSETFPTDYPGQPNCKAGDDFLFGKNGCVGIPDEELIYVCKSDNGCFGITGYARFDAYFRKKDLENNQPIPDVIKNCTKPTQSGNPVPGRQIILTPTTADSKRSLQLRSFGIKNESVVAPWLSPYCKPAIYLYSQEKTNVNVKVEPLGKMTLTIPKYPKDGWKVIAYPDGKIDSNNSLYDYLYYEAEIPNEFIEKPEDGFVVKYNELSDLFNKLLPELGLNEKESNEFSQYWLKALPESSYYFVGIVPKKVLDEIAPLDINPLPDNVIRVTLYFEALKENIDVNLPSMPVFKRDGFTVVEWGGLFKRDKNHPFTCLM